MARPEKPIDPNAPFAAFAAPLRELRRATGLTLRDLAPRTGYSPAVLSQATAGHKLPTWEVVHAYVVACGGDVENWFQRWRRQRMRIVEGNTSTHSREADLPLELRRMGRPPLPMTTKTIEDFIDCMWHLRIWAGNDSLREMEHAARRSFGKSLTRSTLHGILRDKRLPRLEVLEAFLDVCGIKDDADAREWVDAWRRLTHAEETAKQHQTTPPNLRQIPPAAERTNPSAS